MKKILFLIGLFLLLAGGALVLILWLTGNKDHECLTLYGNVDVRQVQLAFRVGGRVEHLLREEGDLVESNELVAKLDPQPYADEVLQARAAVEAARARLRNDRNLLARREKLVGSGGVSQEDVDNAMASARINEAEYQRAMAALGVAQANLSYTELYAPSQGTILTRVREPGSVVRAADTVYTLSVSQPVWVRAFVAEPDLGLVAPGMKAWIYTDTPGGKPYEGHIGFISPEAEFTPKSVETTQLRTDLVYRLRIVADNPDKGLRQGMPVTVEIPLQGQERGCGG